MRTRAVETMIDESGPDKNGTITQVWDVPCSRCGGTGVYGRWGTCFLCGGAQVKRETHKVYTPEHRAKLDRQNQQAEKRRRRKLWDGYGKSQGHVYIATGDTFAIKDQLKEAGFQFETHLGWYSLTDSDEIATQKVTFETYTEPMNEWDYCFNGWTFRELNKKPEPVKVEKPHIGEIGEKRKEKLTFVDEFSYDFYNPYTYREDTKFVYSFETESGGVLKWFTTAAKFYEKGEQYTMSYTVKAHERYKGTNETHIKSVREVKAK